MQRRTRALAEEASLATLVLAHGALLLGWAAEDARPERSICCDLVGPVAQRMAAHAAPGGGGRALAWSPDRGLLPDAGARAIEWLGGDPDGLVLLGGLGLLVAMVAVARLARQLGGPLAGIVAAGVLPCVPALALAGRRWDVYGAQAGVLCLAAWALVSSRSLTRVIPTVAFTSLALAGSFLSPRETDGFLVLLSLGAMGLGAGVRGLLLGVGPDGAPAVRWRVLLGGVFVVGCVAAGLDRWLVFTSPEGLGYYLRESSHNTASVDPATWSHRLAVVGRLFWRDLTPWLAVPVELATVAWLLRGRGRAELGGWLAIPLLVLSLLPKKNHYYASVLIPVLPVVLGLGVAALPGRWLRRGIAVGVLGIASVQLLARTMPEGAVAKALGPVAWQGGDPTWGRVFQTSDGDMDLAPDPDDQGAEVLAAAVVRATDAGACGCGLAVRTRGRGPWSGTNLHLLSQRPCLPVKQGGRLDQAAVLLVSGEEPETDAGSLERAGLPLTEQIQTPQGIVRVHARTRSWLAGRCPR